MAGAQPSGSDAGNQWYRLTPDIHGSYAHGTWSTLSSMHDTRFAYSSAVLQDGRVFVAGGEYGSGTATAEVYDPMANTWTLAPPSGQSFLDSTCKILPSGKVLIAPVFPNICGRTMIFDPKANAWAGGPVQLNACDQDEASWVKLPDESILTIDPFGTNTERYIPSINQWVNDAIVPVAIYDSTSEMGAGVLLPDGRAFFLGGTGHTALYTPSGNVTPGSWTAGPDIPNGHGTSDAPAAMMVNGKVFCVVGPSASANGPSAFYEYDPVSNSFTAVNGPTGSTDDVSPQQIALLDLPDGTVLYCDSGTQLYVYTPDGSPLAAGKPTIANVVANADGSFHLTGTLLNGISEGAAFGDDLQMDSNYPLVRLSDGNGNVYYGRSYNWSSTDVMTGARPQSTEFTLPSTLPAGTYSLVVVANGISSDPVPFTADALRLSPATGFTAEGIVGGPFAPDSRFIQLNNAGNTSLNWGVGSVPFWLTVSPTNGTLASGSASTLQISINESASTLGVGITRGEVWFINLASGFVQKRVLSLSVNPSAALQPYFNTVQLFEPVAYWRLDETNQPSGGGIATNLGTLSAQGNGTFSGVVAWISGPLPASSRTSTSFEGISAVTVPYNTALSLKAPFIVEAWMQPSVAQTPGNVVCAMACGHFSTSRSGWLIYQTGTGWNFRMYNQNQLNTSLNIESGPAPVAGTWYHLVAVYDGSQGHIYVNGVGNSGTPSGFVANTDGPFTIGTRSDNAFGFSGAIADVAVYTNALSALTVLSHYQNGTNNGPAGAYDQLVLGAKPLIYTHLQAPFVQPIAVNHGILGSNARGFYQLGCVPGVPGIGAVGFGAGNSACQFNGAAGYLNVPGTYLDFTNSMSIVVWVQASPANGLFQCILGKGDSSYRLEISENGVPQFADGADNAPAQAQSRIDDGSWHQLVGVYDRTSGTNYLYVDGIVSGLSPAPAAPAGGSQDFRLGGAPDSGTARNFSGALDEVALFTNALSAAQVAQLYLTATNAAALSPQPPVVRSSQNTEGSVGFNWNVSPGLRYQLQYSTNLTQAAWLNAGSSLTATGGVMSVSIPLGPEAERFYRAMLLP